ncbi:MAG TPA: ABC transporter ATP-binding protein [Planctomycetota bacterium]|nr:ABC transporter ATP-binding protein [Planctomycetota bacterium]
MPVIETNGLVKHYKNVHALKGVNISVEAGEIYGLLGRNGAGKTTLVKILLGIVHPTEGTAKLLGRPVGDPTSRARVGFLPEDHRLPDYHTAETALDFYAGLSGVPGRERRMKIPAMIEQVGLKDAARRKVRTYSKGMKQRLCLAQAMLHDPDVLFLDEPTDGVDPVGRKEIRELLAVLKGRGKTIFLNSHLLSEVELICDRVAIIELGTLRREGNVRDMTRVENVYALSVDKPIDPLLPAIQERVKGVRRVGSGIEVTVEDSAALNALVDFLRSQGFNLTSMVEKKQTLEEVFLETLEAPPPAGGAAAS